MSESRSARPFFVEHSPTEFRTEQLRRTVNDLADLGLAASNGVACLICGVEDGGDQLKLLAARGSGDVKECSCARPSDLGVAAALNGEWSVWSRVSGASSPPCQMVVGVEAVSRLVLPLGTQEGSQGVMQLFRAHPEQFSSEDAERLVKQASVAAIALRNARLYDRAQVLFYLTQTVSSTLDMGQIGNLIAEKVAKAIGAKGCTVRSLERLSGQLQLVGAYGLSHQYLFDKGPVIASASIHDALDGKPTAIHDVSRDERVQYPAAALQEGIAAIASIPMVVKGVVTGVLRVYVAKPHEFPPDEMAFLCAAGEVAAAAVENARLYDGIRSDFDTLMDEIIFMRRAAQAVSHRERSHT